MSDGELKPCTHCGGEVKLKELQFWAWLSCEGCGARYENDRHAMGDKFVEAWNRRVPASHRDEIQRLVHIIGLELSAVHNCVATDDVDAQPDDMSWRVDTTKATEALDELEKMLMAPHWKEEYGE